MLNANIYPKAKTSTDCTEKDSVAVDITQMDINQDNTVRVSAIRYILLHKDKWESLYTTPVSYIFIGPNIEKTGANSSES